MAIESSLTMALVGCGNIAQAHWRGIQSHAQRIQITACVDADIDRARVMAEQTESTAFESLDDALEKGSFDSVNLMLPHDMHEEAALKSFAARKHVVLEKPISTTVASAERILEVGREAGVVLMVAEQAQYWTDVLRARQLIDEKAIGEVLTAQASFYDPTRIDPDAPVPWRFIKEKSGGGVFIDGGAHWIRPLRLMLGEVDTVIGSFGSHIPRREVESYGQALIKFESGVVASFQAVLTAGRLGPIIDFRITGSEGEIVIERGREGRLMLYNFDYPRGLNVMSAFEGKSMSYGAELADFCRAVLDGGELAAAPEYALGELRTALAMYRSESSGKWEKVWD